MSSETPDVDPPSPSSGPECRPARRALSKFFRGGISVEEERGMRAHILECEICAELYRESVESAATLGGARRRERIEETRLRRHEAMRERALALGGKKDRPRFFGLRMVALVGAVIIVLTWLNPSWNTPEYEVTWESGDVRAAGEALGELTPSSTLRMGDWCLTKAASSARMEGPRGELWLGHFTQVLVEDAKRDRVRLQRGTLEISGASEVCSQYGVARLEEGRARIDIGEGRLEVECLAGRLEWIHSGGRQVLEPGDRAHARGPGQLLSVR